MPSRLDESIFIHYNDLKVNTKLFRKASAVAETYKLPLATVLTNMIPKHKDDCRKIKGVVDQCPKMVQRLKDLTNRNFF